MLAPRASGALIRLSYRIRNHLRSEPRTLAFVSVFLDRGGLAALYDTHGTAVFNLCLRTVGSREPAAIATRSAFLRTLRRPPGPDAPDELLRLLAAARHDAAALAGEPVEAATSAVSAVADANRRLALAHRDVLALRHVAGCSYDRIAALLVADRDAVAELLWRARVELRDRLEGSVLVSIAAVAEPCRRTLPLIAMRLDGELEDAGERRRLQAHLRTCGKCRLTQEAMRDADAGYRAWPQEQPPPDLAALLLTAAAPAA
jgi:Putative zinc-finger